MNGTYEAENDSVVLTLAPFEAVAFRYALMGGENALLRREVHEVLAKCLEDRAEAESPSLEISCDGSYNNVSGVMGWAWTDGRGATARGAIDPSIKLKKVRMVDAHTAELLAIWHVLDSHPNQSLRILTDSQYAIDQVESAKKIARDHPRRGLVTAIRVAIKERADRDLRTTFVKVKGHNGHDPNEEADLLAVRARKARERQVGR